jgi:hypothetical protein
VQSHYQRPSRKRLARLTPEQIHQAVADQNVDLLLNEVAAQRKLPGYQFTHIAVDGNGKGLCLKAYKFIPVTPPTNKSGLCEYSDSFPRLETTALPRTRKCRTGSRKGGHQRKIATALGHPMPAIPSAKDSRGMMMHDFGGHMG